MEKTMERWAVAMKASAARAGVSIEGLEWDGCEVDRTWGDRVGYVFYGAAPEVCVRAAKHYEAWIAKHGPKGSYGAQRSVGYVGEMTYLRFSNGAKGWYRGRVEPTAPYAMEDGFVVEAVETRTGYATSDTYYPCAD